MPDFRGPRLKIERAKEHINELHTQRNIFAASDYYTLHVEKDPQSGKDILKFKMVQFPPEDWALIMGDAIHNLKSALDFAVNDIVFSKLGKYSDFTRFPFRKTRDELVAAMKGGTIRQASETIATLIVEVIRPYKGGNDALYALHELNILDKHRLLLPVVNVGVLTDVDVENDVGEELLGCTLLVDAGRVPIPLTGNLKIKKKGKPSLTILFDKGLPMQGQFVVPTLIQFAELVTGVVGSFEVAFRD